MTKVLFYFSGTGINASQSITEIEGDDDNTDRFYNDVIRVYFNGCNDINIGGSYIFGRLSPNLDIVGEKVRKCFDTSPQTQLSISALKQQFGNSIKICMSEHIKKTLETHQSTIMINEICLMGFSRGAVTTFSAARALDNLNIPIKIFAKDPVPGESSEYILKKNSEFQKNCNLINYKNITYAEVIIGAYNNNVNLMHNIYFKQMVPKFNANCKHHIYIVPKFQHNGRCGSAAIQSEIFLNKLDYTIVPTYYIKTNDLLFFYPKSELQQIYAYPKIQYELLPSYRETLQSLLDISKRQIHSLSDSQIQGLFALKQWQTNNPIKIAFEQAVLNNKSPQSKKLINSLIEFENIIQYTLEHSLKAHKNTELINNFRTLIYQFFNQNFLISTVSAEFPHLTINHIHTQLKMIKPTLILVEYKHLKQLLEPWLTDNFALPKETTSPVLYKHYGLFKTPFNQYLGEETTPKNKNIKPSH